MTTPTTSTYSPSISDRSVINPMDSIKGLTVDFITLSGWKPRQTPEDSILRADILREIMSWNAHDDPKAAEVLADSSCSTTERAYGATSPAHRRFNALYNACVIYVDDAGTPEMADAVRRFGGRLARGEAQGLPVLNTLAGLLGEATALFTDTGADAIVSCTIEAMSAMALEYAVRDMEVIPKATRWPEYLRLRTGICAAYAHFMFMRGWRETPESYVQLLPYLEHWIWGVNDILSFYKEEVAGEKTNYVHARAAAELLPPITILHKLVDETLESGCRLDSFTAGDQELQAIWEEFKQGYLEFHIRTKRYRLMELGVSV